MWEGKVLSKIMKKSSLDEARWFNIKVGSCIVTFCDDCRGQRTHHCVDNYRNGGDVMFVFLCDYCRFNSCGDV